PKRPCRKRATVMTCNDPGRMPRVAVDRHATATSVQVAASAAGASVGAALRAARAAAVSALRASLTAFACLARARRLGATQVLPSPLGVLRLVLGLRTLAGTA